MSYASGLKASKRFTGYEVAKRPIYFIVGKPCTGKSTLAHHLSRYVTTEVVDPLSSVNEAIRQETPIGKKILETLEKGEEILSGQIFKSIEKKCKSNNANFKGFIFEEMPISVDVAEGGGAFDDIKLMESLLQTKQAHHIPVLIRLRMSDEDAKQRMQSQMVDSLTNKLYTKERIDYSKEFFHNIGSKKAMDDDIDIEFDSYSDQSDEIEDLIVQPNQYDVELPESHVKKDPTSEVDEALDEDERKERELKEKKAKALRDIISGKYRPKLIREEVLQRLVSRPEDLAKNVEKAMKVYGQRNYFLDKLQEKYFGKLNVIELDATQSPLALVKNLIEHLEIIGIMSIAKLSLPQKISIPDTGFRGLSTDDVIRFLCTDGVDQGTPRRDLSAWGKYCPVSFVEKNLMVIGIINYASVFKNLIFLFLNEECLEKFLSNPYRYIEKPPILKDVKMCVLGGPFSGKTTQAHLIAQTYNLAVVDIDAMVSKWDDAQNDAANAKKSLLSTKIFRKGKLGKMIASEAHLEIVKYILKTDFEHNPTRNGWIIDGFPKSLEQVNLLISSELCPTFVIVLHNDINDENVRGRAENYVCNSKTGKPFQKNEDAFSNPEKDPFFTTPLDINMYPNFDNLYNGFKEEYQEIMKLFEEMGTQVVPVPAAMGIETVLSVIQNAADPFMPKATPTAGSKSPILPPVEMGLTKHYCPVTLKDNVLRRASKVHCVRYECRNYYLVNEEAKQAFIMEPHNFIYSVRVEKPPPPRLIFIGPANTGKTLVINSINTKNIPVVQFLDFLQSFALRQNADIAKEIAYMISENAGLLSPQIIIEMMRCLFEEEPYQTHGFILEGFPRSKMEAETLIKSGFHVDACIVMKIDDDIAVRRYLRVNKDMLQGSSGDIEGITDEAIEICERQMSKVMEVSSTVTALSTIPVIQVDANKFTRPIISFIKKKLAPYLEYRESILQNATELDEQQANVYLQCDYKTLSPFRMHCPVELSTSKAIWKKVTGKYPVAYGDYVYYLANKDHLLKFVEHPLQYVNTPKPQPRIMPRLCIVGRPKSGKTTLAKQIAATFGLEYFSMSSILEFMVASREPMSLREKIKSTLLTGSIVPDEYCYEAIERMLNRGPAIIKGWVLDGFPMDERSAKALEGFHQVPHKVIELVLQEEEMKKRIQIDWGELYKSSQSIGDDTQIIGESISQEYDQHIPQVRDFFTSNYGNWVKMEGTHSKWFLRDELEKVVLSVIASEQEFSEKSIHGQAASLSNVCVNLNEMEKMIGKFRHYCPVRYIDHDELYASDTPDTSYVAVYKGMFYKMRGKEELQLFLNQSDRYVEGKELPEMLPRRLTSEELKSSFPAQIELRGYCPVTFKEGPPGFGSILCGSDQFSVCYGEKIYAMLNEEKLQKFMRKPWIYVDQTLPKKLPPRKAPIVIHSLPISGYLEQSVASALNAALLAVGKLKPKYPYQTLKCSALYFIALYLKAHNPRSTDVTKQRCSKELERFKSHSDLIKFLARNMIQYIPPEKREAEFETSMGTFLDLNPARLAAKKV